LQQQNDDLTFGLEERVISLKARIREMKMKIGELDPQGRKEPKINLSRSQPPEKSDLMAIKAKLLGRK
jgi:hypothetical protein